MKYFSLNNPSITAGFKEAVIRGIAPDKGLYFPETIPALDTDFIRNIQSFHPQEIAYEAIHPFTKKDIPEMELRTILEKVLDFDFPLVPLGTECYALELFHGPTMAFKDVGARFMAQCLGYFSESQDDEVTVLVATSGDTGGAVANGFLGVPGVNVVILYPEGKVSDIQERQLTTLGQNVKALRVKGAFDDCQDMVKSAFLDSELTRKLKLTSANSINVARWLPQMFYYLFAYQELQKEDLPPIFSVPSGNFGNICAGIMAWKMGMPVSHFIAATNVNDTVPAYMNSGIYRAQKSVPTISNAMDVGNPSNFIRILELFRNNFKALSTQFSSFGFTDTETKTAMREIYEKYGYIADPHGAVGYLGLRKFTNDRHRNPAVFLETAHPVKFKAIVEETLGCELDLPPQISKLADRKKEFTDIASYGELKDFLLRG